MQPPPPPPPGQNPPCAAYPPYQGHPQPGYPVYPGQPAYPGAPTPRPPSLALQGPSTSMIALKYGLIFGALLAVGPLLRAASYPVILPHLGPISSDTLVRFNLFGLVVVALISWGIYFLAGLFTARRAKRVGVASIACLWASLCYLVIYGLIRGIGILFSPFSVAQILSRFYFTSLVIDFALVLILHIGVGLGIGALGGMLGAAQARRQASPIPPP